MLGAEMHKHDFVPYNGELDKSIPYYSVDPNLAQADSLLSSSL